MGETLGILLPVIQLLANTPVVTSDSPGTDLILEQKSLRLFWVCRQQHLNHPLRLH